MATDDTAPMTPAAAVTRHFEWLEFALAAARDEESRRRERLGKSTDKNREKRTVRLAEVTAEVRELAALVQGLKALRAPAVAARRRTTGTTTKSTTKPTPRRRAKPKATAAAIAKSATSPAPTTTPDAPKAAAAAKPKPTRTAKPKTTRARPATRRRTTKPPTSPA